MTMVLMQFGDGSHKEIEVTSDDPETAVREAHTFVHDNAWFEVQDEDGHVQATKQMWDA